MIFLIAFGVFVSVVFIAGFLKGGAKEGGGQVLSVIKLILWFFGVFMILLVFFASMSQ